MKTKHTPAPWTTQKTLTENIDLIRAGEKGFVIAQVTKSGITQFIGSEGETEAEANLKLIASAPELLRALQLLSENITLSKLNIRKDFDLINAHANALKVIHKATE